MRGWSTRGGHQRSKRRIDPHSVLRFSLLVFDRLFTKFIARAARGKGRARGSQSGDILDAGGDSREINFYLGLPWRLTQQGGGSQSAPMLRHVVASLRARHLGYQIRATGAAWTAPASAGTSPPPPSFGVRGVTSPDSERRTSRRPRREFREQERKSSPLKLVTMISHDFFLHDLSTSPKFVKRSNYKSRWNFTQGFDDF